MTLRDELLAAVEQENDALRARVRELEALCGVTFDAPPLLMLTGMESRMLGMLVKLPLVRKEAAMAEMYGLRADGDVAHDKIVDVFICKLRKKLKPHGIVVGTKWGQGFYLAPPDKARVRALCDQWSAAA